MNKILVVLVVACVLLLSGCLCCCCGGNGGNDYGYDGTKGYGESCTFDWDCASGSCEGGYCS